MLEQGGTMTVCGHGCGVPVDSLFVVIESRVFVLFLLSSIKISEYY
jgi:hypothetical protein